LLISNAPSRGIHSRKRYPLSPNLHSHYLVASAHIGDSLDAYPTNRDAFWSSLATVGTRVYFCGHEHFYDRARINDGDGNPTNDLYQYIIGTGGSDFYPDNGYTGDNGPWTPMRQWHTNQYGYVLGEVYGSRVTLIWKGRTSPGVFQAGELFVFNDTSTTNGISQGWLDYYGLTNDLSDTDGDGLPEWKEYVAGTDPTDPVSCLRLNIRDTAKTNALIWWANTDNRTYGLWFCPDLVTGSWQSIGAYTNLPSGTTWYTNSAATNAAFYRVSVVNTNM